MEGGDGRGSASYGSVSSSSQKLVYISPSRGKAGARPPNKKKHEEHLEELNQLISSKESTKRELVDQLRSAKDQLAAVREDRETFNNRKNEVFEKLDFINKEAQKKGEQVQKLRSGVIYSAEAEVDQQIRKLEYQIQKNNFKLAEEKRIVSEMDRLRRSKKILKDYTAAKNVLDELRGQQRELRDKRELIFRESRDLRRTEDAVRLRIKQFNERLDAIKRDVDHYWEEKRSLVAAFKQQEAQYRTQQRQQREELKERAAADRARRLAEDKKEREELRALQQPYEEEVNLCHLLINYCQSLLGPTAAAAAPQQTVQDSNLLLIPSSAAARRRSSGFSAYTPNSEASSKYATPLGCTPVGTPLNGTPPDSIDASQPGFYKKKDDVDPVFFPGSKRKSKKGRGERKMSLKKGLSHCPETFQQFAKLKLSPPSSLQEVNTAVELIKTKLKLFERLASEESAERVAGSAEPAAVSDSCGPDPNHPVIMIDAVDDDDDAQPPPPPPSSLVAAYDRQQLKLDLSPPPTGSAGQLNGDVGDAEGDRQQLALDLAPSAGSAGQLIVDSSQLGSQLTLATERPADATTLTSALALDLKESLARLALGAQNGDGEAPTNDEDLPVIVLKSPPTSSEKDVNPVEAVQPGDDEEDRTADTTDSRVPSISPLQLPDIPRVVVDTTDTVTDATKDVLGNGVVKEALLVGQELVAPDKGACTNGLHAEPDHEGLGHTEAGSEGL